MRRLAKIAGALLLVLVVVAGGLAAWGWYELRANGARIREAYASGLARVRPAFMEDQDLARTHPILAPAGRAGDAGPTMNPRIGWDGDPQRVAQWLKRLPRRSPPLGLDEALVARIPKDWWSTPPEVWKGLDFSWLPALASFDHWDVESNSPWADAPATSWPNGFPEVFELTPWVKLRLAKGLRERQTAEAVAEVEHLATLLLSTEILLGEVQGLHVLVLLDEALASLERRGETPPSTANRMDNATRGRAFRAAMAARDYLLAESPELYRGEAERVVVGRCAALNEALHLALALREAGGHERMVPFHWLPLDGHVASSCRLTWVRRALAAGTPSPGAGGGVYCEWVPPEGIAPCHVAQSIPFVDSLSRDVALELMTQMTLANASTAAWYQDRQSAGERPCEPSK